ncbi:MAG: hypothetical protein WC943_04885 [Elusimicrobiota bacterium]
MKKANIFVALAAGALVSLAGTGCTVIHTSFPVAQSHFDYPNSNVTPLGHVKGTATASGLMPTLQDADMEEKAIAAALAQKGGDILVDYHMTTDVKMIPLLVINLYVTTLTVEGTAVKMEIGKQVLH